MATSAERLSAGVPAVYARPVFRASIALLAALSLGGALLLAACRTDRPQAGDTRPPDATLELKRKLRTALRALPPVEGEPLDVFFDRARAALVASDDLDTQRSAAFLPDEPGLLLGGFAGEISGVLLGAYARSRSREARTETLRSLLRHKTVNPPDVETPGLTPDFSAFEADLKARAGGLGLSFDHVDHIAWEVALPVLKARGGEATSSAPQRVGVLVHADVVPAMEPGWTVEPFAGVLKDGALYGRGALDDKGALVAVMFAIDALQDAGVPLLKQPVLIIGTSEETHWEGIDRYAEKRGLPDELFVADGAFPVGVGEKGVLTLRATSTAANPVPATAGDHEAVLLRIEGGDVANQVPATARATLRPTSAAAFDEVRSRAERVTNMKITVVRDGDELVVSAAGEAAHGAAPQDGHNAISDLIRFLSQRVRLAPSGCVALLEAIDQRLGPSWDGKALGLADRHPRFSPSTINVGTARTAEDGSCTVALNLRWPPPRSADQVKESVTNALRAAVQETSKGRFDITVKGGGLDPFLVDDSAAWVSRLTEAYTVVSGESLEPITLSGTTYAKAAPGSVTFGPGRPGDHNRIHGPDEYITLDELDELTELYTMSLLLLAGR